MLYTSEFLEELYDRILGDEIKMETGIPIQKPNRKSSRSDGPIDTNVLFQKEMKKISRSAEVKCPFSLFFVFLLSCLFF